MKQSDLGKSLDPSLQGIRSKKGEMRSWEMDLAGRKNIGT
jgi:hypothetical protein